MLRDLFTFNSVSPERYDKFAMIGGCAITTKLLQYAKKLGDDQWWPNPSISVAKLPEWAFQDPILKKMAEHFQAYERVKFNRFYPQTYYNFHTDSRRKCTLNLTLYKSHGCHTLFIDKEIISGRYWKIQELDYQVGRYYLFNTQVRHGIINLSSEIRYTINMSVGEATYEEALDWCAKEGLISLPRS